MTDDEVDWNDPQSILGAIIRDGCTGTPTMVERLLSHCGFEEIGELPGRNRWRVVVWAHRARDRHRQLAQYQLVVQHPERLSSEALRPIVGAVMEACVVAKACGIGAPGLTL